MTDPGELTVERARTEAEAVLDPELPMLTIGHLGLVRKVTIDPGGKVIVAITPTYTGCPATPAIQAAVHRRLLDAGFADVEIRVALSPPWSTDWISPAGRQALADAGISPPGKALDRYSSIPLRLRPLHRKVRCPRCGAAQPERLSEYASTQCTALYRCGSCAEPFSHVKEI